MGDNDSDLSRAIALSMMEQQPRPKDLGSRTQSMRDAALALLLGLDEEERKDTKEALKRILVAIADHPLDKTKQRIQMEAAGGALRRQGAIEFLVSCGFEKDGEHLVLQSCNLDVGVLRAAASGLDDTEDGPVSSGKRKAESGGTGMKRRTLEMGGASLLPSDAQDRFLKAVREKADRSKLADLLRQGSTTLPDLINRPSFQHVSEGRTPLAYAVAQNHERVARDLIHLRANVNHIMGDSTTALTLAVSNELRDGTEMVRVLLSKGADPAALARANIDKDALNPTMRYWLARAESIAPQSEEELLHLAKTPPMERMQEIQYALIGQGIAIEMVKRALCTRFANPQGRKSPLVLLLLGPPGHGKTCISRNLAKSLVGEENYLEIACGPLRDDADLFGSRLGGATSGTHSSDGQLVQFLRGRESEDTIVFLDEFEKIKNLTSALGWDQAKKMYQAFLEPWQEGTLTDVGAGSKGKIDCRRTVWILTSNWGQQQIIDFADANAARVYRKRAAVGKGDADWVRTELEWVRKELIEKTLVPLVMREFKGVHPDVQALARRITFTVPFLPFTEAERVVVADSELRHRLQLYREPAIPKQHKDAESRTYGSLHLRHTLGLCQHAAACYKAMEGADSMTRIADDVDGIFISMLMDRTLRLSEAERRRIRSNQPPVRKGDAGYVAEPQFWAHFDPKSEQISHFDPKSEQISILQHAPERVEEGAEEESAGSEGGGEAEQEAERDQNPFDA